MLYQLSYTHHKNVAILSNCSFSCQRESHPEFMARQEGLEPSTYGLEGRCSIQLSYWRRTYGRGDRIRTCDPLVPNQMRYQTALLPEGLII